MPCAIQVSVGVLDPSLREPAGEQLPATRQAPIGILRMMQPHELEELPQVVVVLGEIAEKVGFKRIKAHRSNSLQLVPVSSNRMG